MFLWKKIEKGYWTTEMINVTKRTYQYIYNQSHFER
jgi:hypothetical protein